MKRLPVATVLRWLVSLALLAWLLSSVDRTQLSEALQALQLPWAVAALCAFAAGQVLLGGSMRPIVAGLGKPAPLVELLANHFRGLYCNALLPSTQGGDVYKTANLGALTGSRSVAAIAVLAQRLLVLFVTLASLVAGLLLGGPGSCVAKSLLAAMFGLCLVAVAGLIVGSPPAWLVRLASRLPGGEQAVVRWQYLQPTLAGLLRSRSAAAALALIVMYQLSAIGAACAMSQALELPIDGRAFTYLVPLAALAGAVPISTNGFGVREAVYFTGLVGSGASRPHSLAFAVGMLGVAVLTALAGGILYAVRKPDERRTRKKD